MYQLIQGNYNLSCKAKLTEKDTAKYQQFYLKQGVWSWIRQVCEEIKKVLINSSYSTSRSSEVEEVNGFSGTLKNVSMSVKCMYKCLIYFLFVAGNNNLITQTHRLY